MRKKHKKITLENFLIDSINIIILLCLTAVMLIPFLHELNISLSSSAAVSTGRLMLLPKELTLEAYQLVLKSGYLVGPYINSIVVTIAHTILSLILTSTMAYALSHDEIPFQKLIMMMVIFVMVFNVGMIPNYLWIKDLKLIDTLWSLILPGMVVPYNLIVMKNFFSSIPKSLEESAFIDGANPIHVFFSIIVPLSKPVYATVLLWVAVGSWNNFMNAFLYLNDRSKYTLPVMLKEVINGQIQAVETGEQLGNTATTSVVAATLMLVVVPILCIYPFIQKHFVKGVMVGSVKE